MPTSVEHITFSALKSRGWNERLVALLLGQPDKTAKNPHYKSGPPMKLYALPRVEAAEQTIEFQESQPALGARRQAAEEATNTKRTKMLEWANNLTITVPAIALDELAKRACRHYNDWSLESDYPLASPKSSSREFLKRITVNFLRHQCSRYDEMLTQAYGKVGIQAALAIIRKKVYQAIGHAYPHLKDECRRQKNRKAPKAKQRQ
jgi:hypothetical protein